MVYFSWNILSQATFSPCLKPAEAHEGWEKFSSFLPKHALLKYCFMNVRSGDVGGHGKIFTRVAQNKFQLTLATWGRALICWNIGFSNRLMWGKNMPPLFLEDNAAFVLTRKKTNTYYLVNVTFIIKMRFLSFSSTSSNSHLDVMCTQWWCKFLIRSIHDLTLFHTPMLPFSVPL